MRKSHLSAMCRWERKGWGIYRQPPKNGCSSLVWMPKKDLDLAQTQYLEKRDAIDVEVGWGWVANRGERFDIGGQ